MNINDAFPSTYLKAADLKDKGDVKVKIAEFGKAEMDDGVYKPVLKFVGAQKALVLNRTNATTISEAFGPNTENWIGREVILFVMKVQGPNGLTDGIRMRAVSSVTRSAEPPPPASQADYGAALNDDEIPF